MQENGPFEPEKLQCAQGTFIVVIIIINTISFWPLHHIL